MTAVAGVHRRVLRRETHASRAVPAAVVAVLLVLLALAAAVGCVWLVSAPEPREQVLRAIRQATERPQDPVQLTAVAVAAGLVAIVLIGIGVTPGRRARRARVTGRMALLVDDGVLADAIADRVARRIGEGRDRVRVLVGRGTCTVRVTPTSGVPLDPAEVAEAAAAGAAALGFPLRPRVEVSRRGVIG